MADFDFSLLMRGGPMMWVVGVMAVAALVLFVERTLYLHRGQIRSTAFVDGIKNILAKRRIVEALTVCEEAPGPVAAVVKAALLHAHADESRMRFAVQEAGIVEIPALERRLGTIAAIAQVAPLVGLLGTLLGLITTFYAFTEGGTEYATARALSQGLWQALIVTAASLLVAAPAHLAYHFLSGRVRAIVRDVEWAANEMMRYLLTEYRETAPAAAGSELASDTATPVVQAPGERSA
ncbi:MAG TPA: MotA/TolQ/ExbB proton channel family protein [Candidatus Synoicihabitans sp.]|nr:MotA/TolQ/ExbB proton channel family protein [Candidatus Synoicihabitans sp.]